MKSSHGLHVVWEHLLVESQKGIEFCARVDEVSAMPLEGRRDLGEAGCTVLQEHRFWSRRLA